jgi:hypothetical protein
MATTLGQAGAPCAAPAPPRAGFDANRVAVQIERVVQAIPLHSLSRSDVSPLANVHRIR